jgi:hypothetical protein
MRDEINELVPSSKNKNVRDLYMGTNKFKNVYQPRTISVTDERGDLHADPYKILNR